MWRLRIADGGNNPYLYTTNNFVGRQTWEFDPDYGTPEERDEVEKARLHFWNNRHQVKPSSDVLWRMQVQLLHSLILCICFLMNLLYLLGYLNKLCRHCVCLHAGLRIQMGSALKSTLPESQIISGLQSFGSQEWDASFAIQALLATDLTHEIGPTYLQCCLLMSMMPPELVGMKMETEKLNNAVNVILSMPSKNGGLPAWEPAGSSKWLEILNPTEFFVDIVIEHEYIECTSSVIQALVLFKKLYPEHRSKEIESLLTSAGEYLEKMQMSDGSWYGDWGVCFTYATWFALGGLEAIGKTYENCQAIAKAVNFLLKTQREDGGWGESYRSWGWN